MTRIQGPALLGAALLSCVQVVSAADDAVGVIVAGIVAGVILLLLCVGLVLFCFYKRVGLDEQRQKHRHRKINHKVFVANGGYPPPPREYMPPPPPQHYEKHHQPQSNGYIKHQYPAPGMSQEPPVMMPAPWISPEPPVMMPAPIPPPYVEAMSPPPVHVPYATYHGPPPDFRYQRQGMSRGDTMAGPPPIVIPFEMVGASGTVTLRPHSRSGVHTSKYQKREPLSNLYADDRKRSHSKHRSPSRHRSRSDEFVIQQAYDGTPVIRQVIYVDDDDENGRHKHRSKSRDRWHKKKSSSPNQQDGARIIEIADDTEVKVIQAEIEPTRQSRSCSPTKSPIQQERSRASSVTEAVNALRMSVKGHDIDSSSIHSSSSRAPSFRWSHTEQHRAPDPVAGDVIFFPAGIEVEHSRDNEPHTKPKDEVYSYTKLIRSSTKEQTLSPHDSPVPAPVSRSYVNEGYEVPKSIRRSTAGTREDEPNYQTEHDRLTGIYDIGASMSDRLQNLVEDGDKTRFSHYNVGAMDFGDDNESIQMRVKRPNTPPADIPGENFYSEVIRRPKTPPNDIPLISPRESTEVPPLNLRSTINSPREPNYRPATPPQDFPITPQSSIVRPRPPTPPTDFPMAPNQSTVSPRPPSPPYDVLDSNRTWLGDSQRSVAADPSTGEPGSFEARRRLIEAHLKSAQSPQPVPTPQTSAPRPKFTPTPQRNDAPLVMVTTGVVPPAPPPPPTRELRV